LIGEEIIEPHDTGGLPAWHLPGKGYEYILNAVAQEFGCAATGGAAAAGRARASAAAGWLTGVLDEFLVPAVDV